MGAFIAVAVSVLFLGIYGVAVIVKLFKSFAPAKVKPVELRSVKGGRDYLQ